RNHEDAKTRRLTVALHTRRDHKKPRRREDTKAYGRSSHTSRSQETTKTRRHEGLRSLFTHVEITRNHEDAKTRRLTVALHTRRDHKKPRRREDTKAYGRSSHRS